MFYMPCGGTGLRGGSSIVGRGGRHPLSDITATKLDRNRFFSFPLYPAKATFHSILSFSPLCVCVCVYKRRLRPALSEALCIYKYTNRKFLPAMLGPGGGMVMISGGGAERGFEILY